MNKARNEIEYQLSEEREKIKLMDSMVRDRDETIERYMRELEKSEKKVESLEKDREMLESKRATVERKSEMQNKQLNDRINNLNDLVGTEKESREAWIVRFEEGQRTITELSNELLQLKSDYKDLTLEKAGLQVKYDSLKKVSDALEE